MTNHKLQFFFYFSQGIFSFQCQFGKDQSIEKKLDCGSLEINQAYIDAWVLYHIKSLFFDELPVSPEQINFSIDTSIQGKLLQNIQFLQQVIVKTNQLLLDCQNLTDKAALYEKLWVYQYSDNVHLNRIVQTLKEDQVPFVTSSMVCGWNKEKRIWEKDDEILSPEQVIEYLIQNQIKSILTVNLYYLHQTLYQYQIFMLPVLRLLGVSLSTIHYDFYEVSGAQGNLLQSFLHDDQSQNYSILAHWHGPWDRKLDRSNIDYIALTETSQDQIKDSMDLQKDFKIVAMSHSRLDQIVKWLHPILFIVHQLDPQRSLADFHLLFHSLRHHVIHHKNLSLDQQLKLDCQLLTLYEGVANFLKMDTLARIQKDWPVEIYGDEGWKKVLPDSYQNRYLSHEEINNSMQSDGTVYFLPNYLVTYLETHPSLDRVIDRHVPYVIFPPLVRSEELQGMSILEFESSESLNGLLQTIHQRVQQSQFLESLQYYREMVHSGYQYFTQKIEGKISQKDESLYQQQLTKHQRLLEQKICDYQKSHQNVLQKCADYLFLGQNQNVTFEHSPYAGQDYLKKLIGLTQS